MARFTMPVGPLLRSCRLWSCRKVVEEVIRCKEAGLPIPDNLLPKVKEKKVAKDGDKKAKKKK